MSSLARRKPRIIKVADEADLSDSDAGSRLIRPNTKTKKADKKVGKNGTGGKSRILFTGMDEGEGDDVTEYSRQGKSDGGNEGKNSIGQNPKSRRLLPLPSRRNSDREIDDSNTPDESKGINSATESANSEDQRDRPNYSRAYLADLQSHTYSTPPPSFLHAQESTVIHDDADDFHMAVDVDGTTTPDNMESLHDSIIDNDGPREDADDGLAFDMSELDGAVVVPEESTSVQGQESIDDTTTKATTQPTFSKTTNDENQQEDFISLEGGDESNLFQSQRQSNRHALLSTPSKTEPSSATSTRRLVREDEDLGEGFDAFVQDERLSLSRKAERSARRKRLREMAAMIDEAEGHSGDESSDDEAAQRIAFEKAQSRAAMETERHQKQQHQQGQPKTSSNHDLLSSHIDQSTHDHRQEDDLMQRLLQQPAPKLTPLSSYSECLERCQSTLQRLRLAVTEKSQRVAALQQEQVEIMARETEVQTLLDQAATRYTEAMNQLKDQRGRGLDSAFDQPLESPPTPPEPINSPVNREIEIE